MEPQAALEALALTVESVFVPFSQSRSRDQKQPNLNWRVTVKRSGREILTTDYSAGMAHAPGYKAKTLPHNFTPRNYTSRDRGGNLKVRVASEGEALRQYRNALARAECESGLAMRLSKWGANPAIEPLGGRPGSSSKNVKIEPNPCDVIYSLVTDSDVLDHAGFEDWAENFGYDTDSRAAESIYRACIELALKMRAALGEDGMEQLREAFQDY